MRRSMIIGVGNDLCEVARMSEAIERQGKNFLDRLFTVPEQSLAHDAQDTAAFYAGRFAAKEACAKALGTGITERVRWTDLQVSRSNVGEPVIEISGGALRRLKRLAGRGHHPTVHVSIRYAGGYAAAFVIIEAWSGEPLTRFSRF